MLEQKDLQAIAELIDVRVGKAEEGLNKKIDKLEGRFDVLEAKVDAHDVRFDVLEAKVDAHDDKFQALDARISKVEKNLSNELARTEDILTRKIDKIESDVEELKQYYRINRLENGNMGMILQTLDKHDKRLVALEKHKGLRLL